MRNATGFCADQLARHATLWGRMTHHPFLVETRDGRLRREVFVRWMRQDYVFVEAAVPFIAALLARAPPRHVALLSETIPALRKELALFEERASAVNVELRGAPIEFVTHAYIQYLLATACRASYAEGFTVLYAAERAYHDSWAFVRKGIPGESPWLPFVENWAGTAFREYVLTLESELDGLAERAGENERVAMAGQFLTTIVYECAFWEMAMVGGGWPGLGMIEGPA